MHDSKSIANNFGKFYSELGENLASIIKPGGTSVNNYISKIPRNLNSSRHDNISNVLLKQ